MTPLQVPSTGPRSPSPVIPGAWPVTNPPTPQHKRSQTCPVTSKTPSKSHAAPALASSPDPLHLDHVLNFHQRLSLSLSRPIDTAPSTFVPFNAIDSSDSGGLQADSLPSDDSELTRFTRHDASASLSALADTSVSTTYTSRSTPERLVTTKIAGQPKMPHRLVSPVTIESNNQRTEDTRIHPPPSLYTSSTSSQLPTLLHLHGSQTLKPGGDNNTSRSPPQRPRIVLPGSYLSSLNETFPTCSATSSSPTSPVSLAPSSPIVFASPTSSHGTSPFHASFREVGTPSLERQYSSSYEYEGSPSWETSYGSEYNDEDILRMRSRPVSPSPSPLQRRSTARITPAEAEIRHEPVGQSPKETETRSPSISTDAPALPMLTTLSLPGSPDTSISLDVNAIPTPSNSPRPSTSAPWTLSLSPASDSTSSIRPQTSPTSFSLSLSPVSSYGVGLGVGGLGEGHVVTFPAQSLSSSPFASAFPSPDLDGGLPELRENAVEDEMHETSAAEYAAAIMSSAWGSDDYGSISPTATGRLGSATTPSLNRLQDTTGIQITDPEEEQEPAEETATSPLEHCDLEDVQYHPRRLRTVGGFRTGVLGKVKKLGGKVKKFLNRKGKGKAWEGGSVNVDVDIQRGGGRDGSPTLTVEAPLVNVGLTNTGTIAGNPSAVPTLDPSIIGDDIPLGLPAPPGLAPRARKPRPSLTAQTYASTSGSPFETTPSTNIFPPPVIRICAPSTSNPNFAALRPRSKISPSIHRLSLSALSNFARSSSPSPSSTSRTRPSSIAGPMPAQHSRRYSSAEAESTSLRGTRHGPGDRFTSGPSDVVTRPRAEISSAALPRSRPRSTNENAALNPIISPSITPVAQSQAPAAKKNRRFSLSAISNFAASHWDEGVWAKTNSKARNPVGSKGRLSIGIGNTGGGEI